MGGEATYSRELLPELAVLPGHLLWRAAARVGAALAEVLPPGVDIHSHASLLALGGGVTASQQELAETIAVSRTTMVKVAAGLAGAGLVERVRSEDDRRSYALTRTPAGAAAARRWRRHAEAVEAHVNAPFSAAERDELRELLARVAEAELAPQVPDVLRASTGFLLTRVHARMHREFLAALEPVGVEPRHFATLTALTATGPVPQSNLARRLGLSGASMVQIVDDLEARGLVERRRPPSDRRTQVVHLLPAAPDVLAAASRVAREQGRRSLAPLSPADVERLVVLLRRLVTAP